MQKRSPYISFATLLNLAFVLSLCVSCSHSSTPKKEVRPYSITSTYWPQDSTIATDVVYIYVDNHESIFVDSVRIKDGSYTFAHQTSALDEIYFFYPNGESINFYAQGGMDISISADAHHLPVFSDSINEWVRAQYDRLAKVASTRTLLQKVDTLSRQNAQNIRMALLLKDLAVPMADSLGVRRCLGNVVEAAKPQWLVDEIDMASSRLNQRLQRNDHVISTEEFVGAAADTFRIRNLDGQLTMTTFWADFSDSSLLKLKEMKDWAKKYEKKNIVFVSFCVYAADSASWRKHIEGIPGRHVLLTDGFNAPIVRRWKINAIPTIVVLNRMLSVKQINGDKEALEQEFDMVQDKLASTPKSTPAKKVSTPKKPAVVRNAAPLNLKSR